jgi:hypothetical protein
MTRVVSSYCQDWFYLKSGGHVPRTSTVRYEDGRVIVQRFDEQGKVLWAKEWDEQPASNLAGTD